MNLNYLKNFFLERKTAKLRKQINYKKVIVNKFELAKFSDLTEMYKLIIYTCTRKMWIMWYIWSYYQAMKSTCTYAN